MNKNEKKKDEVEYVNTYADHSTLIQTNRKNDYTSGKYLSRTTNKIIDFLPRLLLPISVILPWVFSFSFAQISIRLIRCENSRSEAFLLILLFCCVGQTQPTLFFSIRKKKRKFIKYIKFEIIKLK